MAMKVRYNVMNGEVHSEVRGGVRKLYSLDPLGNTRALYDATQTKTDTFSYFPSGTVAARTGTTPTPFQWNGGSGYFTDSSTRKYVRARNYHNNLGRWSEQDPIGFDGGDFNLYRYVNNRFVVAIDPSGLLCIPLSSEWQDRGNECKEVFQGAPGPHAVFYGKCSAMMAYRAHFLCTQDKMGPAPIPTSYNWNIYQRKCGDSYKINGKEQSKGANSSRWSWDPGNNQAIPYCYNGPCGQRESSPHTPGNLWDGSFILPISWSLLSIDAPGLPTSGIVNADTWPNTTIKDREEGVFAWPKNLVQEAGGKYTNELTMVFYTFVAKMTNGYDAIPNKPVQEAVSLEKKWKFKFNWSVSTSDYQTFAFDGSASVELGWPDPLVSCPSDPAW